MRRFVALLSAVLLVASVAGSAAATSVVPDSSSFVGNFEMLNPDGTSAGWAKVQIQMPTEQRLVPGSYDFVGANGNSIREGHAVLGIAGFWHDSIANGGSNVAYTEGVECLYTDPGAKYCHAFTGMFVDVLDREAPDYVVFEGQNPDTLAWDEFFFYVGKGTFVLRCVGSSCPTDSSAPPARTVTTPAFTVQWSATNPEEIVSLSGTAPRTSRTPRRTSGRGTLARTLLAETRSSSATAGAGATAPPSSHRWAGEPPVSGRHRDPPGSASTRPPRAATGPVASQSRPATSSFRRA